MCICSPRYPECNARSPYCHVAYPTIKYFSTLSNNGYDFRNNVSEHKMYLMYIGPCINVTDEEQDTNLMSQFIKFYFTSSMLNMFRTLIHPSLGACDFSIVLPHWLYVLVSMCVGVSVWLVGVVSVLQAETIEKSQAPDDRCINVRNMLSIEEVK